MPDQSGLRDPMLRQKLVDQVMSGNYTPSLTAGPGTGQVGDSYSFSPDQEIADVEKGAYSLGKVIESEGFKRVEDNMRQRGILRSSIASDEETRVVESARLQSEAQLSQARTNLLKLRSDEMLANRQLALAEGEAKGEVGGVKTVSAKAQEATASNVKLGIETQAKTATEGFKSSADIARENNTTQKAVADIQKAISEGDNEAAERIATANNLTATQLENIRSQTQTAIASGAQTGETSRLGMSLEAAEKIAYRNFSLQSEELFGQGLRMPDGSLVTIGGANKDRVYDEAGNYLGNMNVRTGELTLANGNVVDLRQETLGKQLGVMGFLKDTEGYDLSTPDGVKAFQDHLNDVRKTYSLSASDTKEIEKWKLSASSAGFDMSTEVGRTGYKTWLDTQASTYQLSAEDQKEITRNQIAVQAQGYDVFTPKGMSDYRNFLQDNATKFNLSADDMRNQFAWNFGQKAQELDLTLSADRDKFFSSLNEGARQFNMSELDKMSLAKASLESDQTLARLGINASMMTSIVELLSSPLASEGLSDDDIDSLTNRLVDITWVQSDEYGVKVPDFALAPSEGTGVTPLQRAGFVTGGKKGNALMPVVNDFRNSHGSIRGDSNYKRMYDFDDDGKIGFEDFFILTSLA